MEKNKYFLLVFIYIVTIFVAIYFSVLYRNSKKSFNNVSDSSLFLDVNSKDYISLYDTVKNYSSEKNKFIIYIVKYDDKKISLFEEKLSKLNLNDKLLRINVNDINSINNINSLINDFGFDYSLKKSSLPLFIVFNDGRITDILDVYSYDDNELKNFMEMNI